MWLTKPFLNINKSFLNPNIAQEKNKVKTKRGANHEKVIEKGLNEDKKNYVILWGEKPYLT